MEDPEVDELVVMRVACFLQLIFQDLQRAPVLPLLQVRESTNVLYDDCLWNVHFDKCQCLHESERCWMLCPSGKAREGVSMGSPRRKRPKGALSGCVQDVSQLSVPLFFGF